jgi:two-component system, LytTR family, response regulator LytT
MPEARNIKVLIVEDEVLIAEDLKDLLNSFGIVEVEMAHSKASAISALKASAPHLALLDIRMEGELDGLEIAEHINSSLKIPFVFITSHSDLATIQKIVKVKPAGYLTKPFKKSDLFAVINLVADENNNSPKKILIKDGIKTVIFEPGEIDYIEGEGNYINIYAGRKRVLARQSLESIVQQLDSDKYFRIHRSFVINLERIVHFTKKEVVVGGTKIPIARSILGEFEQLMSGKGLK